MSNEEGGKARICSPGENVAIEILTPRDVPLGGPRAMLVRRTLPQRQRSFIGAWCFVDHYGPDDVSITGGMDVAPHPHTGLQTVSWLFKGEIEHIDSGGARGMVRPGEVNLMTAGNGICHSETSTEATTTLHGVQLWVALPDEHRFAPRNFEHYEPGVSEIPGADGRVAGNALVFLGDLLGDSSPVATFTPLLGAELRLNPGVHVDLEIREDFEHGVILDTGSIMLEGREIPPYGIGYTGIGTKVLHLDAGPTGARVVLIGGTPFTEEIVMWWNFVGRTSEEVEKYREEWQNHSERFGEVVDYVGHGGPGKNASGMSRLPAPDLPHAKLKVRKNPPPHVQPPVDFGPQ